MNVVVVSTSVFLDFFHAFSYSGICFQHNIQHFITHIIVSCYVIVDQKPSTFLNSSLYDTAIALNIFLRSLHLVSSSLTQLYLLNVFTKRDNMQVEDYKDYLMRKTID